MFPTPPIVLATPVIVFAPAFATPVITPAPVFATSSTPATVSYVANVKEPPIVSGLAFDEKVPLPIFDTFPFESFGNIEEPCPPNVPDPP